MAVLTYHIEDTDGEKFSVRIYASVDLSNTVAFYRDGLLKQGWDLIRPLITGILTSAEMTFDVVPEDVAWTNNVVDLLSDIQEKAKFIFPVIGFSGVEFRLTLPTVREVIFTGSGAGKIVDITDVDVAAFLAFMLTSSFDFTIGDSHYWDLGEVKHAYQWFGKG